MKKLIILPALLLSLALPAQNHPARPLPHEVRIINGGERVDSAARVDVYELFVENAPKAYDIPGPRFAIEGKEGKFYLGIGGVARATVSFDWGNPIHNGFNFTTSSIPMTRPAGDGGLIQFSAATSGLFVNFVALPGTDNQLGVYLNANLKGRNYGFNLQYAYIRYRGITAGYNYSLFSDMAAAPPSIDNEGPCGFTAVPNGVVDYTHSFGKHWSIGAGVEMPMASATVDAGTRMVSQRVPDVPAYVQYAWGGGRSWVRMSAILRNMLYRDIAAGYNRDAVGWGVKVSGSAALTPWLTSYYQLAYGKGITSYFQGLYKGALDLVPSATPGRLDAVKAWGGYVGLQYNISPSVFATTTYSHVRNYARHYAGADEPWGGRYRYAQYALVNVMWNISSVVQTGLEYIYGRRVDMGGATAHDSRIQTMLCVSF